MKPIVSIMYRVFEKACVVYVCVSIPLTLAFERTAVISGSMAPTLRGNSRSGDSVLIDKLCYRFRSPRRGELVSFFDDDGRHIIKRVVGLPGETVSIADGQALIDGRPLTEPAAFRGIRYFHAGAFSSAARRFRVAPSHYFVLGDDSRDSDDSRYWGALRGEKIRGRAIAIIWPGSRMQFLSPSRSASQTTALLRHAECEPASTTLRPRIGNTER